MSTDWEDVFVTRTRSRSLLGALVLAAMLTVLLRPAPAFACSCVMWEPDEFAQQQDASFVGTLQAQRGEAWTFEVEQVFSGELPEVLTVHAPIDDGGNCGLFLEPGARVGIGLYGGDRGWETSGCSTIDAETLIEASDGYPPVAVEGTPAGSGNADDAGGIPWALLTVLGLGTLAVFGAAALIAKRRPTTA